MKNPSLYRTSVGIMLINKNGEVFMAKKTENIDTDIDFWQMPQGGVEEDENLDQAVARELYEETGIKFEDVEIIHRRDKDWLYYDIPSEIVQKIWNGRYIGQKQKWFLLRAKKELEINLNVMNETNPEFYVYTWVKPSEIKDFSIWFRHDIYTEVLKTFEPYISC